MKNILPPVHTSAETAFLVNDYPYGFRLRCKIRYWLETGKQGVRLCSQTTNPKVSAIQDIWNKPKKSTYAPLGGAMFLDDKGHVTWSGASYYAEAEELAAWLVEYRPGLSEAACESLERTIAIKRTYADEVKRGEFSGQYALMVATLTGAKRKDQTIITLSEAQEKVRKVAGDKSPGSRQVHVQDPESPDAVSAREFQRTI